ncbi:MAG: ComEC/Rec2 family competence protein, partial [Planctomycetaceae bacterium]
MAAGRLIVSSSVRWTILRNTSLIVIVAVLAAARWTMISEANRTRPLHQLAQRDNLRVVIDAAVSSVPIQHARAVSRLGGGQHTNRWQTRFVAECLVVHAGGDPVAADGTIQVFVDGQAARRFGRGDTVRITGRLSWPDRPGNPGEFDFATFLSRRGGAGMLFVAHPQAVQILRTVGPLTPGYWLTRLRRAAQSALNSVVDPKYQGIASALLLGSRTEIPSETQEVFIGSGTMHLLAISGLHIGILYLLLIRVGHWLLIPWNQLLVLIALFCIFYAFMTDLRPSVVRATVFAVLFTASQVTVRQVSLPAVIGQTACLMLLWQPYLVFDTGAWLSFLSVTGLAWATRTAPPEASQDPIAHPQQDRAVPLTPTEHLQHRMLQMRHWLAARYRPMLWIMAATIPLIAWSFHVVSPVGLIVNVVLIAWTMLTLWLGFAAIMLGVLVPFVPNLPGIVFSWMLGGLAWIVETAASVGAGHLYFADLPFWFLPTWYGLLITAVSLRRSQYRKIAWLGLCGLISSALWVRSLDHADHGLRCTVLDVGHGSAAVVELPGSGVMLVDADEIAVIYRFGAISRTADAGLSLRLPAPIEHDERVRVTEV